MTVELGHFALVLALALALVQSVVPVIGARRGDERMMAMADWASPTIFALLAAGMAAYGISTVLFVRYTPWGEERA